MAIFRRLSACALTLLLWARPALAQAPPAHIADLQNWSSGLPAVATWNVVGFNTTWQANQIRAGHRLLPSIFLALNGASTSWNSSSNRQTATVYLTNYSTDIKYLSSSQVPLCLRTNNLTSTFSQPQYSLMARGIEAEHIPACLHYGLGLIPYSPMQKGLLSGKVTQAWIDALPASDHRRADPQFNEPLLARNLALNSGLRDLARRLGTTSAEIAIAWVLRQPRVTSAIVGARRPGQLAETIGGGSLTLTPEVIAEIEALLKD